MMESPRQVRAARWARWLAFAVPITFVVGSMAMVATRNVSFLVVGIATAILVGLAALAIGFLGAWRGTLLGVSWPALILALVVLGLYIGFILYMANGWEHWTF